MSCQSPPSKVVRVVSTSAISTGEATGSSRTGSMTSRMRVLTATAANRVATDENPTVPRKKITNSLDRYGRIVMLKNRTKRAAPPAGPGR